jgi:hypothetical protein
MTGQPDSERNIPAEYLAAFAARYPGIARLAQTSVVPFLADLARQAQDREEEILRAKMFSQQD